MFLLYVISNKVLHIWSVKVQKPIWPGLHNHQISTQSISTYVTTQRSLSTPKDSRHLMLQDAAILVTFLFHAMFMHVSVLTLICSSTYWEQYLARNCIYHHIITTFFSSLCSYKHQILKWVKFHDEEFLNISYIGLWNHATAWKKVYISETHYISIYLCKIPQTYNWS